VSSAERSTALCFQEHRPISSAQASRLATLPFAIASVGQRPPFDRSQEAFLVIREN
jgi:hypothetical protein